MRRIFWLMFTGLLVVVASGFISTDKLTLAHENEAKSGNTATSLSAGGSISGAITYSGTAAAPKKLAVTKDVAICGKSDHLDESLVVGAGGGIKDVIVSVTNVKGGKSLEAMGTQFVLDQKGCAYVPHVSLLPVNKPLQILNSDGILHNIHSFSTKNTPVNLPQPKFKKKLEKAFTATENISVKCDVHGWMSAWVMVVDHPYHAVTDASGKFTITDVPPGTYTVEFWQEALGKQTTQVTVAAGATATLNFKYPAKK
jgi:hypothetical protein